MENSLDMKIIGRIYTDFPTKFGIPRQSGLVDELEGKIVFSPEYRSREAVRGLEGFDYLWLIWYFSEAVRNVWSPTVRPPILGGNKRMGVFSTRSPFRPNPIGLSSVKLKKILPDEKEGPILIVSGVDMMNGTPILDIKPYMAYVDSHPAARAGFTNTGWQRNLTVECPPELLDKIPQNRQRALLGILAGDPRPTYHEDPRRIYGFNFSDKEIKFIVEDKALKVIEII